MAYKHGMTGTPVFYAWQHMMKRCYNPKDEKYPIYGGRGITVCEEWHDSKVFIDWALTHGWEKGLTLDREDVNGDYDPTNCRWITQKQQANNRQYNIKITYDNETHTLSEWADIMGVPFKNASQRYHELKYRRFDQLFKPVRKCSKKKGRNNL